MKAIKNLKVLVKHPGISSDVREVYLLTATAESVWMLIETIVSDAWDDITSSVSDGIDSTIRFFANLKDKRKCGLLRKSIQKRAGF